MKTVNYLTFYTEPAKAIINLIADYGRCDRCN